MGIIAHYPLTNDLSDISGLGRPNLSGTLVAGGIFGNCLNYSSGTTNLGIMASEMGYESTIAFWAKASHTTSRSSPMFGTSVTGSARTFDLFQYPDNGDLHGSFSGGANWVAYDLLPNGTWHHIVLVGDTSGTRVYRDGVQYLSSAVKMSPDAAPTAMLGFRSGQYQISDFRLYDHVLSMKEIKELARGKMLHYAFNSDREVLPYNITPNPTFNDYGSVSGNHAWNATLHADAVGISSWSTGYNGGVGTPASGYHAKWVIEDQVPMMKHINDNGQYGLSKRWMGISSSIASKISSLGLAVGGQICISWDQQTDVSGGGLNVGFYTRTTANATKWETGKKTHTQTNTNKWERQTYVTTIGSDTDVNNYITVYFYGHYSADGTTVRAKNIQIEIHKDKCNPFKIYDSNSDQIISDVSGLDHTATMVRDDAPVYQSDDSIMGSGYMHFPTLARSAWDDTKRKITSNFNHGSRQISASIWARHGDLGTMRSPLLKYSEGTWSSGQSGTGAILLCIESNKFKQHGWGSSDPGVSVTTSDNQWHHFVWTFDYDTRKANMFVDGVHLVVDSVDTEGGIQPNTTGYVWTVGGNPRGYSPTTAYTFNGDIADVRLYGTLLDGDDVTDLYESKANLDNQGVLSITELNTVTDASVTSVGEETVVRISGPGNNSPNKSIGGCYVDGTKVGYNMRGLNVTVFDRDMSLWAVANFDLYSDDDWVVIFYTDKHENYSGTTLDQADEEMVKFLELIPSGYLVGIHLQDSGITSPEVTAYLEEHFYATEISKLLASRDHYALLAEKDGQFYHEIHRNNATTTYATSYEHTFVDKKKIISTGVANFNDACEVGITDGLVGYWKFDSSIRDVSGNNWSMGDSSTQTNGLKGYVSTTGMMDGMISGDMTMICFVTVHVSPTGTARYGIAQAGSYNQEFAINTLSSNAFQCYMNSTDSSGYFSLNGAYTVGQPTVLVYQRDGSTGRVYTNGVLRGTRTTAINPSASGSTYLIGSSYTGTMGTNATIHEHKQFNRALTEEEIALETKRLLKTAGMQIHKSGTIYVDDIIEGH